MRIKYLARAFESRHAKHIMLHNKNDFEYFESEDIFERNLRRVHTVVSPASHACPHGRANRHARNT